MHATNIFAVFAVFFDGAAATLHCELQQQTLRCSQNRLNLCASVPACEWHCLLVCMCCTALHCYPGMHSEPAEPASVHLCVWVRPCECPPVLHCYPGMRSYLCSLCNEQRMRGIGKEWEGVISGTTTTTAACSIDHLLLEAACHFASSTYFFCLLFALCFLFLHFVFIEGFLVHSLLLNSVTNSAV